MVVLRESEGANKSNETLVPTGPATATLADGKVVEVSLAWFEYLGDMHIRFVFDGPDSMLDLTMDEFAALHMTPDDALKTAVGNVKRVYGPPVLQCSPMGS